ncbi:PDZ domain-containing protein [Desulfohalobium retbaense]|uniref:PDZ/DHR/GLGF domain protein n=1 Tax=Desulfohalobium retbaense (strain ATCC 49708 / DSM 5692 / JCM 16813 / HR100) TaxID=485915 RepID=C8X5D5_DESRD|nr:PDZ domain-containing protein [Desulfohalobium retbaense]ACV69632.1 PDZ/DHR/GLGF domain protein [Desulfohalobium retbaense DSM 5692]
MRAGIFGFWGLVLVAGMLLFTAAGCKTSGPAALGSSAADASPSVASGPSLSQTLASGWDHLLDESFTDNARSWPEQDTDRVQSRVAGGVYTVQLDDRLAHLQALTDVRLNGLADFRVAATFNYKSRDKSYVGLLFGAADVRHMFRFRLEASGRVSLSRVAAGEYTTLVKKQVPDLLNAPGGEYHLAVVQEGDTWRCEVNGREVFRLPAEPVYGGRVGLYAYGKQRLRVHRLQVARDGTGLQAVRTWTGLGDRFGFEQYAFSEDGRRLATWSAVGPRGLLALWDVTSVARPLVGWRFVDHPVRRRKGAEPVHFFNTNGQKRFAVSDDGTLGAVTFWFEGDTSRLVLQVFRWDDPATPVFHIQKRAPGRVVLPHGVALRPDNDMVALNTAVQGTQGQVFASGEVVFFPLYDGGTPSKFTPPADGAVFMQHPRWSAGEGFFAEVLYRPQGKAGEMYWVVYPFGGGGDTGPQALRAKGETTIAYRRARSLDVTADERLLSVLEQEGGVRWYRTHDLTTPWVRVDLDDQAYLGVFGGRDEWGMLTTSLYFQRFAIQDDRVVPLGREWCPFLAQDMIYSPDRGGWLVAGAKQVRLYPDYAQAEHDAALALHEAEELLQVGFAEQAEAKLQQALDLDYTFQAKDTEELYLTLLPRMAASARARLPGRLALEQYQRGRQAPKIPVLGLQVRSQDGGVVVQNIHDGTPAVASGLRTGDHILRFQDRAETDVASLVEAVRACTPGQRVNLQVRRGDTLQTVSLDTLARWKEDAALEATVYGLFNYGLFAAEAGQPALVSAAADAFDSLLRTHPGAVKPEKLNGFAAILRALALAGQGQRDEALAALLGVSLDAQQHKYILKRTAAFAPLYGERDKLAYVLDVDANEIPQTIAQAAKPQPYPDLQGRLVRPPSAPELQAPLHTPATSGSSATPDTPVTQPQSGPSSSGGAVILE